MMPTPLRSSPVDLSTTPAPLCLACASTIPDKALAIVIRTPCCARPICAACATRSPRLARYNPCIACLGGVDAVAASSSAAAMHRASPLKGIDMTSRDGLNVNVDGGLRDADMFVVGDDDEEEETDGPPPYEETVVDAKPAFVTHTDVDHTTGEAGEREVRFGGEAEDGPSPRTYYVRKGDTLAGIALRFGIDGRTLCRANNLPATTLNTTPHLLHTRTSIVLPASMRKKGAPSPEPLTSQAPPSTAEDKVHAAARARERAEKRFQIVAKEVDWRVARAYVALASPDASTSSRTGESDAEAVSADAFRDKRKESGVPAGGSAGVEERALDAYLEDEEWEASERRAGRAPRDGRIQAGTSQSGVAAGWRRLWNKI